MADEILIADDDPVVRHILSMMLSSTGNTVTSVESGTACLKLMRERAASNTFPLVVFLDVQLQDVSGPELLEQLRALVKPHRLPVILVSANSKEEFMNEHPACMPDYYLEKPFVADQVLSAIRHVCEKG